MGDIWEGDEEGRMVKRVEVEKNRYLSCSQQKVGARTPAAQRNVMVNNAKPTVMPTLPYRTSLVSTKMALLHVDGRVGYRIAHGRYHKYTLDNRDRWIIPRIYVSAKVTRHCVLLQVRSQ